MEEHCKCPFTRPDGSVATGEPCSIHPDGHPCLLEDGTFEHDLEHVEVDNGDGIWHQSSWHQECKRCGESFPDEGYDYDDYC